MHNMKKEHREQKSEVIKFVDDEDVYVSYVGFVAF